MPVNLSDCFNLLHYIENWVNYLNKNTPIGLELEDVKNTINSHAELTTRCLLANPAMIDKMQELKYLIKA